MCARVYCKFEQLVVVSALLVECCSKIKFKLAASFQLPSAAYSLALEA